jgi:CobQ-like glutamine amidotransferase family enzyme
MQLRLAYFYPSLMNLYGNRGNVQTLALRCRRRGIELLIEEIGIGDQTNMTDFDLAVFGGGNGKEQQKIGQDLFETKINNLRAAIEDGLVTLTICGGFHLFGEYYRPLEGPVLKGISIFDARTEGSKKRAAGDIIIRSELKNGKALELIGFENHSGRTYLGPGCRPLGRVISGFGNNGRDKTEGARYLNCFGTYLHGPLLPKNPVLADYLLELALERRYGINDLAPLDDSLENETRRRMLKRIKGKNPFKGRVRR